MLRNGGVMAASSDAGVLHETSLPAATGSNRLWRSIADPNGEGARACLTVYAETARAAADAADARAAHGVSLGPLDGTIVSIKDLFDVAGEPTRAGSKILADEAAAREGRRRRRAPAARRRRSVVAKTNMTEFAFPPRSAPIRISARRAIRATARGCRAARRPAPRSPLPTACARSPSAAIPAVRYGSRRRLRYRRLQAEPPAHPDRGRISFEHHAGFRRATGAQRRRLRQGRCGHGRRRF